MASKKQRHYQLKYWYKTTFTIVTMPFNNSDDAHKYLYEQNLIPQNIRFVGWK